MSEQQLPKYQCHKIVEAMRVDYARPVNGNPTTHTDWILADENGNSVTVSEEYIDRFVRDHVPINHSMYEYLVGGYYVRYPDGYESWSPKDAFEQGYTRLDRLGEPERTRRGNEEGGTEAVLYEARIPPYNKDSECPKCGCCEAGTLYMAPEQGLTPQMKRTCAWCYAVRWERPLDQISDVEKALRD